MRMRLGQLLLLPVMLSWCVLGQAQPSIQVLPADTPLCFFAGETVPVSLKLRNNGTNSETLDLGVKISQAASRVVMPIGTHSVKALTLLPGQTVLETAAVTLPEVRAETTFVLQWLRGTNVVIGVTKLTASPRGALAELEQLGAGKPIALIDPDNFVREVLGVAGVETVDLDPEQPTGLGSRLAIFCPGNSNPEFSKNLAHGAQSLVNDGVGVVWICPPGVNRQALAPSIEVTRGRGEHVLILAERGLLWDLAASPCAQKRLVQMARIALGKDTLSSLKPTLKEVQ